MAAKILVSTAYLPPVEYFSLILRADEIFIEREENYLKQTYRNRCKILSAHGPQILSVPVYLGSLHKIPIKDIRIDYSKRWQQVHLRAMTASYNSSPFFEFYFENIEKIISKNHEFLLDLNIFVKT
ncbi:MAG: WbqC family protein [Bacteroidia bacterium]|nr:WbqC family protein [Bacteroidia bacterium]